MKQTTLYVVATPIGNLEDITLRALDVLKEKANYILAEDTRVTQRLLDRYDIHTSVGRLDAHAEGKRTEEIVDLFEEWGTIALVSDAGMPTISDPGYRFVAAARAHNVHIEVIPGPSALTAALSVAGIPADEFVFLGFLPHKKGRQTLLKEIAGTSRTVVLYESTHRIVKLLGELCDHIPSRQVYVARELTKIHEEVLSGTPVEVQRMLETDPQKQKGEFVVIIAPMGE